eukprot:364974-Chlamydomonas_euryale.AAC.4
MWLAVGAGKGTVQQSNTGVAVGAGRDIAQQKESGGWLSAQEGTFPGVHALRTWALVERIPGSKAFSSASMSSAPEVPCLNDFRFFLPASPASRPALPVHVGAESASAAACLRCVRLPVPLGDVSAPGAAACTRDACRQPR